MNYQEFDISAIKTAATAELAKELKHAQIYKKVRKIEKIIGIILLLGLTIWLGIEGSMIAGLILGGILWGVLWVAIYLAKELFFDFSPETEGKINGFIKFADTTLPRLHYVTCRSLERYDVDFTGERRDGRDFIVIYEKGKTIPCGLITGDSVDKETQLFSNAEFLLDGEQIKVSYRKVDRKPQPGNMNSDKHVLHLLLEEEQYGYNQDELTALGYDKGVLDANGFSEEKLEKAHQKLIDRANLAAKMHHEEQMRDKDRQSNEKMHEKFVKEMFKRRK
jgi:hypothetical protein